jgi:hypothetical protein
MIAYTKQDFFQQKQKSNKTRTSSIVSFPREHWWSTSWFNKIHTSFPFTLFCQTNNLNINSDPTKYFSVILSSVVSSSGSEAIAKVTLLQARKITDEPNYFQFQDDHFFLLDPVLSKEEHKRVSQALDHLSKNIVDYILSTYVNKETSPFQTKVLDHDEKHGNQLNETIDATSSLK